MEFSSSVFHKKGVLRGKLDQTEAVEIRILWSAHWSLHLGLWAQFHKCVLLLVLLVAGCHAAPENLALNASSSSTNNALPDTDAHAVKEKTKRNQEYSNGPEIVPQVGHDAINIVFDANGRFLASGGWDGTLKIWEVSSGRLIRTISAHASWVQSLAFIRDDMLVSSAYGEAVKYWDISSGKELKNIEFGVIQASISVNGDWIAFPDTKDRVSLVSLSSPDSHVRGEHIIGGLPMGSDVFSADGKRIVTIGELGTIETEKAWSPENQQVARIWSTDNLNLLHTIDLGKHDFPSSWVMAVGPKGLVLAISKKGTQVIELWNVQSRRSSKLHTNSEVSDLVFSPDGRWLAASEANAVRLWDVTAAGRESVPEIGVTQSLDCGKAQPVNLAFSPHGTRLAATTRGSGSGICFWDVESGREYAKLSGKAESIVASAVDPFGTWIATGTSSGLISLWNLEVGQQEKVLSNHQAEVTAVDFRSNGRVLVSAAADGTIQLWDMTTGEILSIFSAKSAFLSTISSTALAVSQSDPPLIAASHGNEVKIMSWDAANGSIEAMIEVKVEGEIRQISFNSDGTLLATVSDPNGDVNIWDVKQGVKVASLGSHGFLPIVEFVGKKRIAIASEGKTMRVDDHLLLWDIAGVELLAFHPSEKITALRLSPDGKHLVSSDINERLQVWDAESLHLIRQVYSGAGAVGYSGMSFIPGKQMLLMSGSKGTQLMPLWRTQPRVYLITLKNHRGVVVDHVGRFDSKYLEDLNGFFWVMPDDPFKLLEPEIYFPDYYEPRLLQRVLAGQEFKPVRALAELNRVQPRVEIASVEPEPCAPAPCVPETVSVTVEVAGDERTYGEGAQQKTWSTGVYDLRLFRDGQLVGQIPEEEGVSQVSRVVEESADMELKRWRQVHRIAPDAKTYKQRLTFKRIRLPRRAEVEKIEFMAYAFNEDRVKSATARKTCVFTDNQSVGTKSGCVLERPVVRKGRAYVIGVGVNAYESDVWDLRYAARDARKFLGVLPPLLEETQVYAAVVGIPLISDWQGSGEGVGGRVMARGASKAQFKAVLDLLAGREVDAALRAGIPNAEQLRTAQPEDLVVIAYSSHGYADQSGVFYLFPYDIGSYAGKQVTAELLQRTISSDDLSLWLRDLDPGELVLIIDACHSAASVEGAEFKPGPMGARGLGQLAYDKGLRILASTRANDVAWESPKMRQGLLSYALVEEGLVKRHADHEPEDNRIVLPEWLGYAVWRVPQLYARVFGDQTKGEVSQPVKLASYERGVGIYYHADSTQIPVSLQQPSLFDFRRNVSQETLITLVEGSRSGAVAH